MSTRLRDNHSRYIDKHESSITYPTNRNDVNDYKYYDYGYRHKRHSSNFNQYPRYNQYTPLPNDTSQYPQHQQSLQSNQHSSFTSHSLHPKRFARYTTSPVSPISPSRVSNHSSEYHLSPISPTSPASPTRTVELTSNNNFTQPYHNNLNNVQQHQSIHDLTQQLHQLQQLQQSPQTQLQTQTIQTGISPLQQTLTIPTIPTIPVNSTLCGPQISQLSQIPINSGMTPSQNVEFLMHFCKNINILAREEKKQKNKDKNKHSRVHNVDDNVIDIENKRERKKHRSHSTSITERIGRINKNDKNNKERDTRGEREKLKLQAKIKEKEKLELEQKLKKIKQEEKYILTKLSKYGSTNKVNKRIRLKDIKYELNVNAPEFSMTQEQVEKKLKHQKAIKELRQHYNDNDNNNNNDNDGDVENEDILINTKQLKQSKAPNIEQLEQLTQLNKLNKLNKIEQKEENKKKKDIDIDKENINDIGNDNGKTDIIPIGIDLDDLNVPKIPKTPPPPTTTTSTTASDNTNDTRNSSDDKGVYAVGRTFKKGISDIVGGKKLPNTKKSLQYEEDQKESPIIPISVNRVKRVKKKSKLTRIEESRASTTKGFRNYVGDTSVITMKRNIGKYGYEESKDNDYEMNKNKYEQIDDENIKSISNNDIVKHNESCIMYVCGVPSITRKFMQDISDVCKNHDRARFELNKICHQCDIVISLAHSRRYRISMMRQEYENWVNFIENNKYLSILHYWTRQYFDDINNTIPARKGKLIYNVEDDDNNYVIECSIKNINEIKITALYAAMQGMISCDPNGWDFGNNRKRVEKIKIFKRHIMALHDMICEHQDLISRK